MKLPSLDGGSPKTLSKFYGSFQSEFHSILFTEHQDKFGSGSCHGPRCGFEAYKQFPLAIIILTPFSSGFQWRRCRISRNDVIMTSINEDLYSNLGKFTVSKKRWDLIYNDATIFPFFLIFLHSHSIL